MNTNTNPMPEKQEHTMNTADRFKSFTPAFPGWTVQVWRVTDDTAQCHAYPLAGWLTEVDEEADVPADDFPDIPTVVLVTRPAILHNGRDLVPAQAVEESAAIGEIVMAYTYGPGEEPLTEAEAIARARVVYVDQYGHGYQHASPWS